MKIQLVLYFLIVISFVTSDERPEGLYRADDKIVILNETNFNETIIGKDHAWIVEFYASWCGYCRNFAPTFKEFAGEVFGWKDVIKVASIDCGDEINNEQICKHANITGFPTIKYYFPFTVSGDTGYNRPSQEHTGEALIIDTIDFLEAMIDDMIEINEKLEPFWPDLKALNANSSEIGFGDIWPEDNEETFVVIEKEESFIGKEMILNSWRRNASYTVIERMTIAENGNQNVLDKMGVTVIPTVIVLSSSDQKVAPLRVKDNSKHDLEKSIRDHLASKSLRNSGNFRKSTISPLSTTTQWFDVTEGDTIRRRYSVYLTDLEKTVVFALQNEVAFQKDLDRDAKAALKQFIKILIKYFPKESEIFDEIEHIDNWLAENSDNVDTQELSDFIEPLTSTYSDKDWIGCRGSQDKFGGYSCGLWMLWHQLTVGQYDEGKGDPREVLKAMKNYVANFFSCRECANHFMIMIKNGSSIENEIKSYKDAVIFLWTKHNEVNMRLQGDEADDPFYPKEFYPAPAFCPDCYTSTDESKKSVPDPNKSFEFIHDLYTQNSLIKGSDNYVSDSNMPLLSKPSVLITVLCYHVLLPVILMML
eukprot:GFUD01009086.1.p1 GENE.GFUD01009086.1~~GFUD01009086.1.p1  ORF type:complete len:591 (-),score=71.88 GFUD01009086.1:87-1859(-)